MSLDDNLVSKSILFIIIDQLRYDHLVYMPNILKIFNKKGQVKEIKIRHLPSSTPSGHATISTGLLPKEHGIFGSEWYDDHENKLVKLINKDYPLDERITNFGFKNKIITFAKQFKNRNYDVLCISGKKDVTVLLGYGLSNNKMFDYDTDKEIIVKLNDIIDDLDNSKNELLIASFSENDKIGHIYGPHSQQVKEHLKYLDRELTKILTNKNLDNFIKIITSDHGVIKTDYVARIDYDEYKNQYFNFKLFDTNKTNLKPYFKINLNIKNVFKNGFVADGICYVFTKNKKLNHKTKNYLQEMLNNYVDVEEVNKTNLGYILNSKHKRLGDLILIPKIIEHDKNFRFVKPWWPEDVKGEHGSISDDETIIPLMIIPSYKFFREINYQDEIFANLSKFIKYG